MEPGLILLGIVTIGGVIAVAVWVLKTLFDAEMPSMERLIWLLIILMFPVIGAFIWLSWGQDSLRKQLGVPARVVPPAPSQQRQR
ncbi:MAG: PLD nuclease N-terminal domain-containing protein [Microterricola sp.]